MKSLFIHFPVMYDCLDIAFFFLHGSCLYLAPWAFIIRHLIVWDSELGFGLAAR